MLVYQDCRIAIPKKHLRSHLDYSHRLVPAWRRRKLEAQFLPLNAHEAWEDLQPWPDGSPPLSYLHDPVPGFYCAYCPVFKTINSAYLRRHHVEVHPHEARRLSAEATKCFLQSWAQNKRHRIYWQVDATCVNAGISPTDMSPSTSRPVQDDFEDILEAEQEEQACLLQEHDQAPALDGDLEHDENSDWLRGCEWPRWFAHRPLSLIVAMSQLPAADPRTDLFLGCRHGVDYFSEAGAEQTLRRLLTATTLVFTRCEDTLKSTPRTLRCWLRSWSSLYLPYPFEMVKQDSTRRRYYRYFQQFLCYVFRVWTIARRLKERTVDLTRLELPEKQCL